MPGQRSRAYECCRPAGAVSSHNQPSAPAWKTSASMSRSSFFICIDTAAGDSATRSVACFSELVSATAINVLSTSMSRRVNPGACEFLIAKMTHLMKFGVKKLNLQKQCAVRHSLNTHLYIISQHGMRAKVTGLCFGGADRAKHEYFATGDLL